MMRVLRQAVGGIPYLQKELARTASLRTKRVLSTPASYYVIFSGRCNIACPFCTIHRLPEPTLSTETMMRIIREAKALSTRGFNISLSGGEPMTYRPLFEALELAEKLEVNLGFTTNGLALTQNNVERALSFNPFNINVSIESIDPKVNESLRPFPNGTAKALAGIDRLLKEKERVGARVSIIVKPTIMEQNYRTLPDLVRHFGKHSRVQINFQPFVGFRTDPFWVRDHQDLRRVFDELLELRREGYSVVGDELQFQGFAKYFSDPPNAETVQTYDLNGHKRNCDIGLRSIFIYPSGDVFFCDFLKKAIGNVHKNSLSEIYYGGTAGKQRKVMLYCNIDCQQTCKRPTPLWLKVRAFLKMG